MRAPRKEDVTGKHVIFQLACNCSVQKNVEEASVILSELSFSNRPNQKRSETTQQQHNQKQSDPQPAAKLMQVFKVKLKV